MKFSTMILASLIAAALLLPSVTPKKKSLSKSCRKKTKKKTFKGDGTYYGDIPVSAGNCAMRGDLSVVSSFAFGTGFMMESVMCPRMGKMGLGDERRGAGARREVTVRKVSVRHRLICNTKVVVVRWDPYLLTTAWTASGAGKSGGVWLWRYR